MLRSNIRSVIGSNKRKIRGNVIRICLRQHDFSSKMFLQYFKLIDARERVLW